MYTVTAKVPEELNLRLEKMAEKLDRKKSYLIRRALENYLEDMEDIAAANSRLANLREEDLIGLEEIGRKHGLGD